MSAANFIQEHPDRTAFAIVMVLVGVCIISANDLATKWISSNISIWQLQFMRSLFGILMLLPVMPFLDKRHGIKTRNFRSVTTRSLIMCVSYLCFFTALAVLPMATVAGAFFSAPLFMVLLSLIILRESVGIWRLSSIIVGLLGVLLILQPNTTDFDAYAILPVCAGFFMH